MITPLVIYPNRKFGPIEIDVILREEFSDKLIISQHPIPSGESISDHAFKSPVETSITGVMKEKSNKSLKDIYNDLLTLQNSKIPFTVISKNRVTDNMLISNLKHSIDVSNENIFSFSCDLVQIKIPKLKILKLDKIGSTSNAKKPEHKTPVVTPKKQAVITKKNPSIVKAMAKFIIGR